MPIDREQMESDGEEVQKIRSNRKNEVLGLLKTKNANGGLDAYTQGEIAKALDIRPQHARQILMDLVQKNMVVRKQVDTGERTLVFYAIAE